MTRNVTVEAHVVMDYPKESEFVTAPQYTLRFAASDETEAVDVSIDGGPWRECRRDGSHFWFDWSNYLSGRHEIVARARLRTGEIEETVARRVRVELDRRPR